MVVIKLSDEFSKKFADNPRLLHPADFQLFTDDFHISMVKNFHFTIFKFSFLQEFQGLMMEHPLYPLEIDFWQVIKKLIG